LSSRSSAFAAAIAVTLGWSSIAHAVPATGLLGGTSIFSFDTAAPGAGSAAIAISGLSAGDSVLGIDFRPTNGVLYGLGASGRLYTINSTTGAATLASTLSIGLIGGDYDISFNPTVDRLRIVGTSGQNLRVNVDTGAVTVDGTLAYAAGDANATVSPRIVGAGYTNQNAGTVATTTLYDLDAANATLVTQAPPNNGTLNTVGRLGVSGIVSFDIDGRTGTAYAATNSALYQVNLATGAASSIGTFSSASLSDFALTPVPEPMTLGLLGAGIVVLAATRHKTVAHAA